MRDQVYSRLSEGDDTRRCRGALASQQTLGMDRSEKGAAEYRECNKYFEAGMKVDRQRRNTS